MMLRRLERKFGRNNPIFLEEIFGIVPEYSRQSVYRFLSKAVKEGDIIKFGKGVYYLPKETDFGIASPSIERIIERKYIRDGKRVYGIYGCLNLEERFGFSDQIPNAIEVITNNASRAVREVEMRERRVILRKSRVNITKENEAAYTLLELFSKIDAKDCGKTSTRLIKEYIEEKKVTPEDILKMSSAFPAKATRNLFLSGVL